MDLQQRAVKQSCPKACKSGDGSDAHFSQEYMDVVVGEVQQALAGRNIAAQQADVLLSSSVSARHLSCEAANAAHSSGMNAAAVCLFTESRCMTQCIYNMVGIDSGTAHN